MKRHHNTLFVTSQGAYVGVDGETVDVRVDGATKLRVPMHMLDGVVCFGQVLCSPALMNRCSERGIGVSFLTERGRFLARVTGPISGNVLLRRAQYRGSDSTQFTMRIARSFVTAKVANCRAVLQRSLRDHPDDHDNARSRAVRELENVLAGLGRVAELDVLRGMEGDAARIYFRAFNSLIRSNDEGFRFSGRSRRPPLDPVNAMLSFAYTLLTHDSYSALEVVGLDPQVGFLHRDRPGRPGLALDLMEELRSFLADRIVLSIINRGQVVSSGFVTRETGAVDMTDETRKALLMAYQDRKQEKLTHPFLKEKTTVGMLVHLQALLLARFIRGELDEYPPFVWR